METLSESKTKYGRKKLDQAELHAQKSDKVSGGRGATKYGHKKGAVAAAGLAATSTADTGKTDEQGDGEKKDAPKAKPLPSIAKLREALVKKPLLVDAMLEAELKSDAPRKGALVLFRDTEVARKKGNRPEVLERIDAAIAAFDEQSDATE